MYKHPSKKVKAPIVELKSTGSPTQQKKVKINCACNGMKDARKGRK